MDSFSMITRSLLNSYRCVCVVIIITSHCPFRHCTRGVGSNLEVIKLTSEGAWQLHWYACVDYSYYW